MGSLLFVFVDFIFCLVVGFDEMDHSSSGRGKKEFICSFLRKVLENRGVMGPSVANFVAGLKNGRWFEIFSFFLCGKSHT